MTTRLLPALLLALALAVPARAQSVAGELVEPGSGAPVPAARVALEDASGRTVHSVLTDAEGRFLLRAPAAGAYRLRAERIGHATTRSEPLRLEEGPPATHRMTATGARVMLEAITVSTRTRCAPRPGASVETAAVWEEVRKALDGVHATRTERAAVYTLELYERDVDPHSGAVASETRRTLEGTAEKPFVTVDPARLADAGYVQREGDGILYAAPDAEVILSERFLDEHCFVLRTDGAPSPGLIGLAFEPVRERRLPDVRGVLWVDRASAELRGMEFEYTRPPVRGPRGVPGGTVEFLRLPDGRWLTSAWKIRMPVEGVRHGAALGEQSRHLIAIREVGGTARPGAAPASPAPFAAADPAADRVHAEPPEPTPAAEPVFTVSGRPASAPARDRSRLITREEVERSGAATALELVQTLRPQWLRARGNDATRAGTAPVYGATAVLIDEAPVLVYVDGAPVGRLEGLRSVRRVEIDRVEYYSAPEAQQRWGPGHQHGAIDVVTRRR